MKLADFSADKHFITAEKWNIFINTVLIDHSKLVFTFYIQLFSPVIKSLDVGSADCLPLYRIFARFRYSFIRQIVSRPGDSEMTFSVFESSCHLC